MRGASVAVTGIGLVTPAGIGVADNWRTVCRGRGTAQLDPDLSDNPVRISCRVPHFAPETLIGRRSHRMDRVTQFAVVAAREALHDAGLDLDLETGQCDPARVGVVLGCAFGGAGTLEAQHRLLLEESPQMVSPLLLPKALPNMPAGQLALEFGLTGVNFVVSTACASGTTALALARDLLLLDRCDVVLAGGSEAMITPLLMAGFARMGALAHGDGPAHAASKPFDARRNGFVAGEGAGVLVLERDADARARGRRARAYVAGAGTSADAHHLTAPHPEARGLKAAIRAALADAGLSPRDIQHVNAHGTATPANDLIEAKGLNDLFGTAPLVTSTKGVTGHLLGAAGAVEAAYTALSLEHGTIPPTANHDLPDPRIDINLATGTATPAPVTAALNLSMGFGGQNAALVLTAGPVG
ncbi:beta-ketoacyl-[acyl-carrier-protein] synthase family protein [Streptomyces sp. NPDC050095]|uniref:beta-ketoacyl-[acyl-carrier-protein] synthase family protein n=1 Tax=unclassified Streptomyces TaxID=2593676 RepID=UPI00343029AA